MSSTDQLTQNSEQLAKDDFELLRAQNDVLKLIAQGQPLSESLDSLLRIIEAFSPGMLASILLLDPDGIHVRHGAAPSLPKGYVEAIDGQPIGPQAGSCGTAAYRREPVIVSDIANDPLWQDYKDVALKYGLRACWSTPIFDAERNVLGTFALYFGAPGLPSEAHKKQIAMVTATAAIAIVKDRERVSLNVANKRLTLAVAAGGIGIWERDLKTDRLVWNNQIQALFGRGDDAQPIQTFEDFLNAVHGDDRPRLRAAIERSISERGTYEMEYRVLWPDGSMHWIAGRGKPEFDSDGRPVCVRGIGIDVTDRKRIDEEIRARKMQLADAQRAADFGSYEWIPGHDEVRWTDELYVIFGLDPAKFTPTFEGYLERVHPEDRESTKRRIEACLRDRVPFEMEERIIRPDGSERWLYSQGRWLFDENRREEKLVGTCQDVTARKEAARFQQLLEDQLRQMQKMESVSRLAGGVAHDFNNLLTLIFGHIDLAKMELEPDAPAQKNIGQIQEAAKRAAALTKHLLAFSRREIIQPSVLDLNITVSNLTKMMHRVIGENISLIIRPSKSPISIKADLGQIDQILMNLVVNAVDAMPKGGKIFIETAAVELDESYAKQHPAIRPGSYAMLSVSDTGVGMERDTLAKVFEPFFTTKPTGKGTGLGLAMVHGAVQQNNGHISVFSQLGRGTTFKIYFPLVHEAPSPSPSAEVQSLRTGSETILLVEDDEALRQLARRLLTEQGYKVLEAKTASAAIALAKDQSEPIHLVLTDVVLPDTNGVELVATLKELRPGLGVIYMSGYATDLLSHHGVLNPETILLPKPFSRHELLTKVASTLTKAA